MESKRIPDVYRHFIIPDKMSDLQATLEFSVELNKFYNVDLFQRGYYQIRVCLKTPPKTPSKIEVSLPRNSENPYILPACMVNGVAVSKTFQILYRNEEVVIGDAILYRLHTLVDCARIEECLEGAEFQLTVELWFSDEDASVQVQDKVECVSQRMFLLHFSPTKGLHHSVPVLFDYFHLCAVDVTVHGTLIALHQPYISMLRPQRQSRLVETSTLETVYFGTTRLASLIPTGQFYSVPNRLQEACTMHRTICNILLSAYESLQWTFQSAVARMSPQHTDSRLEITDCHYRLETLMQTLQNIEDEDELLQTATTDVTQLCAQNVILWTKFLNVVTKSESVIERLRAEHHTQRVKRFAEGFFTMEHPTPDVMACYEPSINGHSDLAALVRASPYYQSLLPLSVECLELDGDANALPVIFEDIFVSHAMTHDKCNISISLNDTTGTPPSHVREKSIVSKSDSSSTQSTHSTDTSPPQLRSKSKKKFIKNIKPDAFKRPSSVYSMNSADLSHSTPSQKAGVELVGYRKTDSVVAIETIPIELGTFSPNVSILDELAHQNLANSSSMPSLFVRGCWSRTSTGSLPEIMNGEHGPKASRKSLAFGDLQTSDRLSDDSSSTSPSSNNKQSPTRYLKKRKSNRLYTAPEIARERTFDSPSYVRHSGLAKELSITEVTELNGIEDDRNANIDSSPEEEYDDHTHDINHSSPMQLGKQDYETLAESLTHALGEPEQSICVDSRDVSTSVKSNNSPNLNDVSVKCSNGMMEDIILTGSELGAVCSIDSTSQSSDLTDKISSITIAEQPEDDNSNTSMSSSNLNGNKVSQTPSCQRHRSDSSEGNEIMTIIELLKMEYAKSQKVSSESEGIATQQSYIKERHKSSSDTDLHQESLKAFGSTTSGYSTFDSITTSKDDCSLDQGRIIRKFRDKISVSSSTPELSKYNEEEQRKLVSFVGNNTVNFVTLKENLKQQIRYSGHLYSDYSTLASSIPYFQVPDEDDDDLGIHLLICVHGLDGNSADLRLVRTYIEMALPGYRIEFLMSEANQSDTFADFDVMTDRLVNEILAYLDMFAFTPARISFIGHSLGTIIVRSALSRPEMAHLIPKLYTFLSLSGPHLGTLYNNSGLVNMGMWFMQKWKKSGSLLQLSLKDNTDPRQTFLYKLSQKPGIELFRQVLLVSSSQDRYVPYHSSRVELCKAAQRDTSGLGTIYCEMVDNILLPIVHNPDVKIIRYDVYHALQSTANNIIGRAAHIAVLDSELFLEKLFTVAVLKYLK